MYILGLPCPICHLDVTVFHGVPPILTTVTAFIIAKLWGMCYNYPLFNGSCPHELHQVSLLSGQINNNNRDTFKSSSPCGSLVKNLKDIKKPSMRKNMPRRKRVPPTDITDFTCFKFQVRSNQIKPIQTLDSSLLAFRGWPYQLSPLQGRRPRRLYVNSFHYRICSHLGVIVCNSIPGYLIRSCNNFILFVVRIPTSSIDTRRLAYSDPKISSR